MSSDLHITFEDPTEHFNKQLPDGYVCRHCQAILKPVVKKDGSLGSKISNLRRHLVDSHRFSYQKSMISMML
jgi:hypothetical protein